MRSTLGRARVTQTVRPWTSRSGSRPVRTKGAPAAAQPSKPPSRDSARAPAWRSQAATPWLSLRPRWQSTVTVRPARVLASSGAQTGAACQSRRMAPGTRRGSAAASSGVRTSKIVGASGVPTRRASWGTVMVSGAGMGRPLHGWRWDAMLGPKPHGVIATRTPWHARMKDGGPMSTTSLRVAATVSHASHLASSDDTLRPSLPSASPCAWPAMRMSAAPWMRSRTASAAASGGAARSGRRPR